MQWLGFHPEPDELITPATLAVRRCADRGYRRVALVMNDAVKEDFADLQESETDVQAIIIGDLGDAFGYGVLNRAFRYPMDGAELIALQKNRFWLTPDGLSLDVGPCGDGRRRRRDRRRRCPAGRTGGRARAHRQIPRRCRARLRREARPDHRLDRRPTALLVPADTS